MFKKLFQQKAPDQKKDKNQKNIELKLLFEIALSDGKLDPAEERILLQKAELAADETNNFKDFFLNIKNEVKNSTSLYPTINEVNNLYSEQEKVSLLENLWKVIMADSDISQYEVNLYFRIADLIKIKRSTANKIKVENS